MKCAHSQIDKKKKIRLSKSLFFLNIIFFSFFFSQNFLILYIKRTDMIIYGDYIDIII